MGSLQDALRQTGLARESEKKSAKSSGGRRGRSGNAGGKRTADGAAPGKRPAAGGPDAKRRAKSDLERAWEARRRAEKAEKERARQARVADQEARRRRNLELDRIIDGRAENVESADLPRYFEHLGRIRRVLCTPEQRAAINAGQLGVVSLRGRYLIVAPEVVEQWRATAPDLVPDLGGAEPDGEDGGDWPPVPDDLTW